jgi:hypothetical protein
MIERGRTPSTTRDDGQKPEDGQGEDSETQPPGDDLNPDELEDDDYVYVGDDWNDVGPSLAPSIVTACLGAFLFGYHSAVINAPLADIAEDLGFAGDNVAKGAIVSIMVVGGFAGGLGIGPFSDKEGRRAALVATTVPLALGAYVYFWLFLVIFGYFWLFLVISGYFWLFLVIFVRAIELTSCFVYRDVDMRRGEFVLDDDARSVRHRRRGRRFDADRPGVPLRGFPAGAAGHRERDPAHGVRRRVPDGVPAVRAFERREHAGWVSLVLFSYGAISLTMCFFTDTSSRRR